MAPSRSSATSSVVCDVFDAALLRDAVASFRPHAVIHQLTDLPDDVRRIREQAPANNRIRREGTRNLIAAARAADTTRRFLAQSVAWELPGDAADLERAVLDSGGVVLRYGRLYGPGTYFQKEPPSLPRIDVDEAARRTVAALDAGSAVLTIVED